MAKGSKTYDVVYGIRDLQECERRNLPMRVRVDSFDEVESKIKEIHPDCEVLEFKATFVSEPDPKAENIRFQSAVEIIAAIEKSKRLDKAWRAMNNPADGNMGLTK